MAIVRGELFPNPIAQPIRAKREKISVEILRPWDKFADVDLACSGSKLFQRQTPSLVIIARDIETAQH